MSNDTSEIRDQLNRIERCLIGDQAMGQLGLVSRVNNHAARIKRLEWWMYRIAAGAAAATVVVGLIYKLIVDWLPR